MNVPNTTAPHILSINPINFALKFFILKSPDISHNKKIRNIDVQACCGTQGNPLNAARFPA